MPDAVRVLYLVQTFADREQIARLVRILRRSDPAAAIVITHNSSGFVLDAAALDGGPDLRVINRPSGSRMDFSLVEAYLAAIEHARACGIDYDWVVNLTGQCYPARPLPELVRYLSSAQVDAFIDHRPVFADPDAAFCGIWPRDEARARYLYQYRWRLTRQEPPAVLRTLLGALRRAVNRAQPWFRLDTSYALQIGMRDTSGIVGPHFPLHGGSYHMALSRAAAEYLCSFAHAHPRVVEHFRRMIIPSEVFPHTVLARNPSLRLSPLQFHHFDVAGRRRGRPVVMTLAHFDRIVESGKFFTRKVDRTLSAELLERLDERVLARGGPAAPAAAALPAQSGRAGRQTP